MLTHVHRAPLLALLAAGLLVAACATGGGSAAPAAQGTTQAAAGEVRIVVRDNVFEPKTVTAPAGRPVTVVFVNEGKNVHEVEIKGLVNETKIQPGETKRITITPEKKSYELYCEIHEDDGMKGEFKGE